MLDVAIPRIGESINSVIISKLLKRAGESVAEGEGVLELDSDKASMELPAPSGGVLVEWLVKTGDEVPIGAVVARIDPSGKAAPAPAPAPVPTAAPAPAPAPPPAAEPKAGPAARQAAQQGGVDLADVAGSGPRGRIVTEDVTRAKAPARPAPAGVQRVPMSPLRRTVARRLLAATQETAMLTTFNEVDMSRVMALRKRHQDAFVAKFGIKLGFMSFFIKASIDALKQFPSVNAEIEGNDILYKPFYHVGVAVSGPKGLVVPVIRDADRLSFAETEQAVAALGAKAKDNKLLPTDFEGGTFTISNGGIFGSMLSTPILNPPQSGILGMHNIIDRPIGVDGQIVLRPMMYLALSYDHRIIDGREAVSFLVRVKACIEEPDRMLLEV
jgi:2-oxoglutarate dehydrogenase E2 component (dihydrolipoamide succinyltransferase)